jgi:hypothetical protein
MAAGRADLQVALLGASGSGWNFNDVRSYRLQRSIAQARRSIIRNTRFAKIRYKANETDERLVQSKEVEELYDQIRRVVDDSVEFIADSDPMMTPSVPMDGHKTYAGIDDEAYTTELMQRPGSVSGSSVAPSQYQKSSYAPSTAHSTTSSKKPAAPRKQPEKYAGDDFLIFLRDVRTDYIGDILVHESESSADDEDDAEAIGNTASGKKTDKNSVGQGFWRMDGSTDTSATGSLASSATASREHIESTDSQDKITSSTSLVSSAQASGTELAGDEKKPKRRRHKSRGKQVSFSHPASPEHRGKQNKEQLRNMRAMQALQGRLETVWSKLYMPLQQRLDMAIQYAAITKSTKVKMVFSESWFNF